MADLLTGAGWAVLGAGLGTAAVWDVKRREVPDLIWFVSAAFGAALVGAGLAPAGVRPLVGWAAVAALGFFQLLPIDAPIERRHPRLADAMDLGSFLLVGAFLGLGALRWGVGANGIPIAALAAFAGIVLARGLYELGWLWGGADAKAVIALSLIVPTLSAPVLGSLGDPAALAVSPFAVTSIVNTAVISIGVPLGLAALNLRRREFRGAAGFLGYSLPTSDLPHRWVWLRDPREPGAREEEEGIETSEDDRRRRAAQAAELARRGIDRVWVYPQLPWIALLALGALAGALVGNVVFDLAALLVR